MDEDARVTANPVPSEGGYWDPAWTGAQRAEGSDRGNYRDILGRVALILMCVVFVDIVTVVLGFTGTLGPSVQLFGPIGAVFVLVATPVALIMSIAGLVRAHVRKYKAPLSLITLLLSLFGTILILLPFIFLATGVWRF